MQRVKEILFPLTLLEPVFLQTWSIGWNSDPLHAARCSTLQIQIDASPSLKFYFRWMLVHFKYIWLFFAIQIYLTIFCNSSIFYSFVWFKYVWLFFAIQIHLTVFFAGSRNWLFETGEQAAEKAAQVLELFHFSVFTFHFKPLHYAAIHWNWGVKNV